MFFFFNFQKRTVKPGDNEYQCPVADNKAYGAVQFLYVNCKLKAEFYDYAAKTFVLCYCVAKRKHLLKSW